MFFSRQQHICANALTLILLFSLGAAHLPSMDAHKSSDHVPDELLVRFQPDVSDLDVQTLLNGFGVHVKNEIPELQVKVLSVKPSTLEAAQEALSHNPMVEYVERNMILAPQEAPDDPFYPNEWHLAKIGAASAWDLSQGSSSIIVAVLDSGVDTSHPDLSSKTIEGYNFYDGNNNITDVYGHGTKVAGVAAAATDNSLGVAAIGWQVKILPIRVTDLRGYACYSALSAGLVYAADKGAKVAVVSFAIYGGSTLSKAARYLYNKGGWAIAAGGNDGTYHADRDNPYIISVSATTQGDSVASFSSYGSYIDLSAPGDAILTTTRGGGYGWVAGTSFSAPLTAGLLSLLFSLNPNLTPSMALEILKESAADFGDAGYDTRYGWGRIDAYQAASLASDGANRPDNIAPTVNITSPLDGAQISGSALIDAYVADNVGVVKVEIYVDSKLKSTVCSPPYAYQLNTKPLKDGTHTILVKAYDHAGNIGQGSITVTIVNR